MSPDERRQAIVDAVIPLLTEHGAGVTTKQVAEAAGIAEGTIFRVFPDKRALFFAATKHALQPPGWREELAALMAAEPELRDKVVVVSGRMRARTRQVMLAMMALRQIFMTEGPGKVHDQHHHGPPAFLTDAAAQLLDALATDVFAPHAAELRVTPEVAAVALRNLVMGGMGPGTESSDVLTDEVVADLLLKGVQA